MNAGIIHEHAFNTAWWGEPIGIIDDAAFFSWTPEERHKALQQYAWVEFKSATVGVYQSMKLFDAGFFQADTRIDFRIALTKIPTTPSLDAFEVHSAGERPFSIEAGEFRTFEHERFYEIPGSTKPRIDERYATWARQIIAAHPDWCLRVFHNGNLQGWFISQPGTSGLNLVLAMLHRDANISGMHLYQKACVDYARRGARIGWANFSVYHTNVHNIYAQMGARFLTPITWWLWTRR